MSKDKDIPKGFPLGFKINEDELTNGLTIDKLIELTKCYHGDKYVVGKDTLYCDKTHYHIHFYSNKNTTKDAMKTFRTNKIKKEFPHIGKSFRFYTGQDLKDVNPELWLAYCIKETQVKVSGFSITDDILIQAKAQLQVKQLKNVHSQKKALDDKAKKDFKTQMLEYVRDKYSDFVKTGFLKDAGFDNGVFQPRPVRALLIRYLKEQAKYGSLKKHFLDAYVLEFMCVYANWGEQEIEMYIYK